MIPRARFVTRAVGLSSKTGGTHARQVPPWDVADLRLARERLTAIPGLAIELLYLGTRPGLLLASLRDPVAVVAERPSDNKHLHAEESVLRYLTMHFEASNRRSPRGVDRRASDRVP